VKSWIWTRISIELNNSRDFEVQIGVAASGRSKWSRRGSEDHWPQLRITLIKKHDRDPAPHYIKKLDPDPH
jgi:hypothetical protein